MNPASDILARYGELMHAVDSKTAGVYALSPEIPCKNKCFDCCKQLFPVSFAEAYYISEGIKMLGREEKKARLRAAERTAEKILKYNPFQFEKRGVPKLEALKTHKEFAQTLHKIETDCPALNPSNPDGACTVYNFRNHDCRTMGASFDASENAIVGCFRFASLKYLIPKLMDFNFQYGDKMRLDTELIHAVTGGIFTPHIFYYTTMCGPLMHDYSSKDWIKFFADKGIPAKSGPDEYWVIIDV